MDVQHVNVDIIVSLLVEIITIIAFTKSSQKIKKTNVCRHVDVQHVNVDIIVSLLVEIITIIAFTKSKD